MLDAYRDIRERIAEPPKWWDEHGVPRYHEPLPEHSSNVYADHVVFLRIACQSCGHEFLVEITTSRLRRIGRDMPEWDPLTLEYGDPPAGMCCMAGDTMSSCPREVVAAWDRDPGTDRGWVQTHDAVPVRAEWGDER